jgi:hypothetical protein
MAMKVISSEYSSRSWPRSSRANSNAPFITPTGIRTDRDAVSKHSEVNKVPWAAQYAWAVTN